MSKMWEVDPETRAKLLQISKTNGNDRCCDCGAPSPQWASPKFGTFICLNCAGTHRGLGVHISFVRSITMDAFKTAEIQRMEKGGNETWKAFYDEHPLTIAEGRTFEDSTIKERYDGDVGEEYKDRLTAKIEGREYVPGERKKKPTSSSTTTSESYPSRSSTPLQGGRASPAVGGGLDGGRKERNEAYFAKLGGENAARRDDVPASQGGKYGGFGGGMPVSSTPSRGQNGGFGSVPALDDFQKDPMGALSKGFGWFSSAVGKGAKTVHDSYIQPTAKTLAETDFAAQARLTAAQIGQNLQTGARGAAESINRFVEGPDEERTAAARRQGLEPERKDFWDDFASVAAARQESSRPVSGAIGTAAMKKPSSSTTSTPTATPAPAPAATGLSNTTSAASKGNEEGGWGEEW